MQNELGVLEFIHALVETLDRYFENVCELDILFRMDAAHFIIGEDGEWSGGERGQEGLLEREQPAASQPYQPLSLRFNTRLHPLLASPPLCLAEEMVTSGCIVETNKTNILKPLLLLEKVSAGGK